MPKIGERIETSHRSDRHHDHTNRYPLDNENTLADALRRADQHKAEMEQAGAQEVDYSWEEVTEGEGETERKFIKVDFSQKGEYRPVESE